MKLFSIIPPPPRWLDHNNLTSVSQNWLYGLSALKELDLNHNLIATINPLAFQDSTPRLHSLWVPQPHCNYQPHCNHNLIATTTSLPPSTSLPPQPPDLPSLHPSPALAVGEGFFFSNWYFIQKILHFVTKINKNIKLIFNIKNTSFRYENKLKLILFIKNTLFLGLVWKHASTLFYNYILINAYKLYKFWCRIKDTGKI